MKCRICNNAEHNKIHTAYEMFFGTREAFDYMECGHCKCVQLIHIPEDMSKHYPSDYYTATPANAYDFSSYSKRNEKLFIRSVFTHYFSHLQACNIKSLDTSILDIGCGNADTIRGLAAMGFKKAVGIDKFLHPQHAFESENCRVYQSDLFNITDTYDIVTFNNSFEHMDDHKKHLLKVHDILADDGICVIMIPIATRAWELYGVDWYQLDPPRHFMLHSLQSMDILLEETGFEKVNYSTRSGSGQFIVSELYKKGIPFVSFKWELVSQYLSSEEIEHFEKLTEECNRNNMGDSLYMYLKKKVR